MHVATIRLKEFMTHKETVLDLPEQGVVVITGDNGGGKSAIVEAVSYGVWGETLRGTDPWSGEKGEVSVVSQDGTLVQRRKMKSSVRLYLQRPGDAVKEFAAASKGQPEVNAVFGAWDVWRRSASFSTSDVGHYSLATDGEQKRLIEGLLGLEVFDPALKACREDLKAAEMLMLNRKRDLEMLEAKLGMARQRKADVEHWSGPFAAEDEVERILENAKTLKENVKQASDEIRDLQEAIAGTSNQAGQIEERLAGLRATLARLKGDTCPTCSQPIPGALRQRLVDEVNRASAEIEVVEDRSEAARVTLEAQLEELAEERDSLAEKARAATSAASEATLARGRAKQAAESLKAASDDIARYEKGIEDMRKDVVTAETEVAVLKAVEQVLGLRGVRSQVLSRALDGLDKVATSWLARIAGPGLRIRLNPYTETKTAGMSDRFCLVVEGAGGGHGYKATSAGQRRRIDVALLFALSEVAAAARGAKPSTLFVDEVFDVLDADGITAVAEVMQEIALDRCVVVITHSSQLAHALRPVQQWHVTNGAIQEV